MANANTEEEERSCEDFMRKDTMVEVATDEDEDSFKGVWFPAKILDPPSNPQSDFKKDRLALVEFQTLLSDDGVSLLVENADANFIRPSPPHVTETAEEPLDLNDFVDAFYLNGWWTGSVSEVKENQRYLVTFKDPPDVMEFSRADLRYHWDWIEGMWVRSKQSLHKQVSEGQRKRSRRIEELTHTSRRKRGRAPKQVMDGAVKNPSVRALSKEPISSKALAISTGEINQKDEAIMKRCTTVNVVENQSLPFAKTSPIWVAVDSMEVFEKFPQKPHFSLLRDCKEDSREGLAIAHMVTFSSTVEKAFGLHTTDPESSFSDCLEALHDLECHGFDIKPVEEHIKNLRSMKEQQERFREKAKNVDKRFLELTQEDEQMDEEIVEISQKLKRLKSKRDKNDMKLDILRKKHGFHEQGNEAS